MLDAVGGSGSAIQVLLPQPLTPPQRPQPPATVPATAVAWKPATTPQPPGADPAAWGQGLQGTQPRPGDVLFAEMANDCYTTPDPASGMTGTQSEADLAANGWTRLQPDGHALRTADGRQLAIDPASLRDDSTGLSASIYSDGQGHYLVAYAGTEPTQFADIKTDAEQAIGMQAAQYDQAVALARRLESLAGHGNVAFTGHSLGGGLAATAAVATGEHAVTLNAAGVSDETLRQLGFENPNDARASLQANGQIRSYSVDGDWLSTVDEGGAPRQLGTQWHAAWKNPSGDLRDPGNIPYLHGGPGDGASYVAILKDGGFAPGVVKNPYFEGGLDLAFSPLGPLAPFAPARSAVLGEAGNVGTFGRGVLSDFVQIGGRTAGEVQGDLHKGGGPLSLLRMDGALDNGALDAAGSLTDRTAQFGGRTVTTLTDNLGQGIRDTGDALGLPKVVSTDGARAVEYTGNGLRDGIDFTGDVLSGTLDKAGDVADWSANKAADLAGGAFHLAGELNPLGWL